MEHVNMEINTIEMRIGSDMGYKKLITFLVLDAAIHRVSF